MAPLRVGLAGLGTVGTGVIRIGESNHDIISRRAGRSIEIVAVSARDRHRDRGLDLSGYDWVDDPVALASRPDVDVVVELIGGSEGPARALAEAALSAGKGLVTANKAMIAERGLSLAAKAESGGLPLKYEAAVAGGIPVIKGLREGAAANQLSRVYGILNGTCNFILSTMEDHGSDFGVVLADAQAMGYAEADPATDIDGTDTAHKLAILASLAFGTKPDFAAIRTVGIRDILSSDIGHAAALGYRIRLIGMAESTPEGLFQRVHPCLVPTAHPLGHVAGAMNAVVVEGNFVGRLLFEGRGAGEGPTASAVMADLIDVARGEVGPAFAMPVGSLASAQQTDPGTRVGRAYLRFLVADRPGVLAELTAAMRDSGVSIESLIQRGEAPGGGVLVVMTTHRGPERNVAQALDMLAGSPSLVGRTMMMPVLED